MASGGRSWSSPQRTASRCWPGSRRRSERSVMTVLRLALPRTVAFRSLRRRGLERLDVLRQALTISGDGWTSSSAGGVLHARLATIACPDVVLARDDPWSMADRVAWGEIPLTPYLDVPQVARLASRLGTRPGEGAADPRRPDRQRPVRRAASTRRDRPVALLAACRLRDGDRRRRCPRLGRSRPHGTRSHPREHGVRAAPCPCPPVPHHHGSKSWIRTRSGSCRIRLRGGGRPGRRGHQLALVRQERLASRGWR